MGTTPPSGGPKKPHVLRRGEPASGADKSKRIETRTTEIDTRELAALIDGQGHGQAAKSAPASDLDAVIEVVETKPSSRGDDSKAVRAVLARGDKGIVVRASRPVPAPPARIPEGSGAMQPTPPDGVAAQKRQRTAPVAPVVESAPLAIEDDPYKQMRPMTESEPLRRETETEPDDVAPRSSSRVYVLLAALVLAAGAAALFYAMH